MYKRGAGEEAIAVMNGFTEGSVIFYVTDFIQLCYDSIRESNSTGKNNKETNLWPPIQTESLALSQLITITTTAAAAYLLLDGWNNADSFACPLYLAKKFNEYHKKYPKQLVMINESHTFCVERGKSKINNQMACFGKSVLSLYLSFQAQCAKK
ncbi:hypothetical protein T10_5362 [Trichinella papuae]|uniref:Uncharacterized protein n=1 Tax=Trichinella papuae TaxID=268474 RepID=A0A0V1N0H2_9BILA|nr:hypothetical protein T10_5362 [Trichinella papuae]